MGIHRRKNKRRVILLMIMIITILAFTLINTLIAATIFIAIACIDIMFKKIKEVKWTKKLS